MKQFCEVEVVVSLRTPHYGVVVHESLTEHLEADVGQCRYADVLVPKISELDLYEFQKLLHIWRYGINVRQRKLVEVVGVTEVELEPVDDFLTIDLISSRFLLASKR